MKMPSRTLLTLACLAGALGTPLARAQDDRAGPYMVAALGESRYDYTCGWFNTCGRASATAVKLGGGYRFGVFALEGWYVDFGRATIDGGVGKLQRRSIGVSALWHLQLAPAVQGFLRVGGAQVYENRSGYPRDNGGSATVGLGLLLAVTPKLGVELAWDAGTQIFSGVALFSVGTRLRF